jgi:hypothetical protein
MNLRQGFKKFLIFLIAGLLIALSACGGDTGDPQNSSEPFTITITAPSAAKLNPGFYELKAEINPASSAQEITFSLVGEARGVSITGGTLAITTEAQNNSTIKVRAQAGSIFAEKEYTIDNPPIWNKDPVVTGVFYDDFSDGVRASHYSSSSSGWGVGPNETPNYMNPNNIYFSTNKEKVEAMGATGGIVVMQVNGDLYPVANRRREGTCLITRKAFGPGLYEVRFKPVPRLGQVTALWTYWNGGGSTLETNKYSEIDIEMPNKADYKQWAGTVYKKYISSSLMEQGTSAVKEEYALNDGRWHTMAFEWRTDEENGDSAIQYYMDGVPTLRITGFTPTYTATFWMGSWFPDNPGWVGIPDFETAYMYIDWVRITSYDDPISVGAGGDFGTQPGYIGNDLGDADIPQNDYIANGSFTRGDDAEGTVVGWNAGVPGESLQREDGKLLLSGGKQAYQVISAQYMNTEFSLTATIDVSGSGKCKMYILEYFGTVRMAKSQEIEFTAGEATKTLTYKLTNSKTSNIRVVIETESGVTAKVSNVKMSRKEL